MTNQPRLLKEIIKCGEPLELNFSFWENGYELPIEDFELSIVMRKEKPEGAKINQWVDGDLGITRDNLTGKVSLKLSAQFTSTLNYKVVYLDCWIQNNTTGDGIKSDVIEFTIDRGVSR